MGFELKQLAQLLDDIAQIKDMLTKSTSIPVSDYSGGIAEADRSGPLLGMPASLGPRVRDNSGGKILNWGCSSRELMLT